MKKIYITVEDTKKGKVVIPIKQKDVHAWYDYAFLFDSEKDMRILKMNNIEDEWKRFNNITCKLLDAISEGRCYEIPKDNNFNKFVVSKNKYWLSGKPIKWRKN